MRDYVGPILVVFVLVASCSDAARYTRTAPFDGTGPLPSVSNRSYDRSGEKVTLRLFEYPAGTPPAWNQTGEDRRPLKKEELLGLDSPITVTTPSGITFTMPDRRLRLVDAERSIGFGEVAGIAAGIVVDIIQRELERESARHIQQYKSSLYADDFWMAAGVAKYAGFEIIRTTKAFPNERHPASHMVFAFVPAKWDRRLFLIQPVYMKINSAAARVSTVLGSDRELTVEADILMTGAFVPKAFDFKHVGLAEAKFVNKAYNLNAAPVLRAQYANGQWTGELASQVAGYFQAPPLPFGEAGNDWYTANRGGVFKLAALVTETDDSRLRTDLMKIAEFVGENKQNVVSAVTKAVGGGGSDADGTPDSP